MKKKIMFSFSLNFGQKIIIKEYIYIFYFRSKSCTVCLISPWGYLITATPKDLSSLINSLCSIFIMGYCYFYHQQIQKNNFIKNYKFYLKRLKNKNFKSDKFNIIINIIIFIIVNIIKIIINNFKKISLILNNNHRFNSKTEIKNYYYYYFIVIEAWDNP